MNDPRYSLTAENIMKIIPGILKQDVGIEGFLEATSQIFEKISGDISLITMYSAIDTLPEDLLGILAEDFKIDWWDPEYSVEEKRRLVRDNWKVHRTIGTVDAVEKAISAVYPDTTVLEWFDYEGEPYHFKLRINITDEEINSDRMKRVLKRLKYYKNLRSWNDGIFYFMDPDLEYLAILRANTAYTGQRTEMRVAIEIPKDYTKPLAIRSGAAGLLGQYRRHIEMRTAPITIETEVDH